MNLEPAHRSDFSLPLLLLLLVRSKSWATFAQLVRAAYKAWVPGMGLLGAFSQSADNKREYAW